MEIINCKMYGIFILKTDVAWCSCLIISYLCLVSALFSSVVFFLGHFFSCCCPLVDFYLTYTDLAAPWERKPLFFQIFYES